MFERFSDRARKVMALANQEAQRFNHEYIGTEHVLLGIVKDGGGLGANVLKNLDVDLRKVRLEVERLVKPGPEMVTMGRLPQTPRVKRVIEIAIAESKLITDNRYVGTEHILIGLLLEHEGIAATVLMKFNITPEKIREEAAALIRLGTGGSDDDDQSVDDKPQSKAQIGLDRTDWPSVEEAIRLIQEAMDDFVRLADYEQAIECRNQREALRAAIQDLSKLSKPPEIHAGTSLLMAIDGIPSPLNDDLRWMLEEIRIIHDLLTAAPALAFRTKLDGLSKIFNNATKRYRSEHARVVSLDPAMQGQRSGVPYCSPVPIVEVQTVRSSPAKIVEALLVGKQVAIVGESGSGRSMALRTVSTLLRSQTSPTPVPVLWVPDHEVLEESLRKADVESIFDELRNVLVHSRRDVLVLRGVESIFDQVCLPAVREAWKHLLADLVSAQRPVVVTTTPSGWSEFERRWSTMATRFAKFELQPLSTSDFLKIVLYQVKVDCSTQNEQVSFSVDAIEELMCGPTLRSAGLPSDAVALAESIVRFARDGRSNRRSSILVIDADTIRKATMEKLHGT